MITRGFAFLILAALVNVAALGCGGGTPRTSVEVPDKYPVRADWLVKTTPSGSGQPSKWYDPGYPPLAMLNQPFDKLKGDSALLAAQVRNRVILNTSSRVILDSSGNKPTQSRVEDEVREEFGIVLTDLFGTPREPKVPSGEMLIGQTKLAAKMEDAKKSLADKANELNEFLKAAKLPADEPAVEALRMQQKALATDIENLEQKIADLRSFEHDLKLDSETLKRGGAVFRNYCQQCHGLTGDGNGPSGRYLIPLPRDYRQGLFKFITSEAPPNAVAKPRRDDLQRTITRGLDGSPMPQFGALKDDEIQAVISYVIHLSLRGEAEYEVMKKAADPGGDGVDREEVRKKLIDQVAEIAPRWMWAARTPIKPDPDPYITDDQKLDAAADGYKLFMSADLNCASCHTNFGRNAPFQFDAWGSIVRPRNLTVATLRGGRSSDAIYARIFGGIPGSNMPAHAKFRPTDADKQDEAKKGVDKLWQLVHFVEFAAESAKRQQLKEKHGIEIDQ
jgi:mono/diheme cytochrome c family protein